MRESAIRSGRESGTVLPSCMDVPSMPLIDRPDGPPEIDGSQQGARECKNARMQDRPGLSTEHALMRTTPWLPLCALVIGCGASPAPQERDEQDQTRGAELEVSAGGSSTPRDLAGDPAWESIPPDDRRGTVTSQGLDPGPTPRDCAGACAAEGQSCVDQRGWQCQCQWHHDQICGGAYRPPDPPVLGWSCAPSDPGADRGDGCPFEQPRAGLACSVSASMSCHYAPGCGWSGVDASCVGGRWTVTEFHMPPPP